MPVSAVSGDQVQLLADLLVARLPEGPQLYPDGHLTDTPEEAIVAELIREAALEGVRDALPHSIAVVVEEMGLREDEPFVVRDMLTGARYTWRGRRNYVMLDPSVAPGHVLRVER